MERSLISTIRQVWLGEEHKELTPVTITKGPAEVKGKKGVIIQAHAGNPKTKHYTVEYVNKDGSTDRTLLQQHQFKSSVKEEDMTIRLSDHGLPQGLIDTVRAVHQKQVDEAAKPDSSKVDPKKVKGGTTKVETEPKMKHEVKEGVLTDSEKTKLDELAKTLELSEGVHRNDAREYHTLAHQHHRDMADEAGLSPRTVEAEMHHWAIAAHHLAALHHLDRGDPTMHSHHEKMAHRHARMFKIDSHPMNLEQARQARASFGS